MGQDSLDELYDDFERIEAAFGEALDESLQPRGPDFLYEVVEGLGLVSGFSALDLGCGRGEESIRLADRFGAAVLGVDPVARHIKLANEALAGAHGVADRIRFQVASAEAIPSADDAFDLIWCRESLYFFALDIALAECRRVLRPGGRMVVYQMFDGEALSREEAGFLWKSQGVVPENADHRRVEEAFAAAGFAVERWIDLKSEPGERSQELRGEPGRRLLHAARMLRQSDRYVEQFGQAAYDIMLGDCYWHIYRLIGKLSARIYVMRAPFEQSPRGG